MSLTTTLKYKTPVFKKDQPDDGYKFQSLPTPTGQYPFHLAIEKIIPGINQQKMVFQLVGDTGSLYNPDFTRLVATALAKQYQGDEKDQPQFLYHLGDIVYNHGEAEEYDHQFFTPYQAYPGPIFAIAGNHDSDVNPAASAPYQSLAPFVKVFCANAAQPVDFSLVKGRPSMVQPNIYWTMETPLASIIGLHSNVPKYGAITPQQRSWFLAELTEANKARPDKMLIICLHHSPYSADINHGSSLAMITFLEAAFSETGVRPDIVISGHVHNYQRFLKTYADGATTTYVVAGAGGYDELHAIAAVDDAGFTGENPAFNNIDLVNYCDNKHGFLKIAIEKNEQGLQLAGEYFSIAHESTHEAAIDAVMVDRFMVKLQEQHQARF